MLRIDTLKEKIYELFFDRSRLVINRKVFTASSCCRYFVVHTVGTSIRFDAMFLDVLQAETYIQEHLNYHPDYNYQILGCRINLIQLPFNHL